MILISSIVTLLYAIVIISLLYGLLKTPSFKANSSTAVHKFSILIPFRNEEVNLPDLLKSISSIEYPKSLYEILLLDDASEDNSVSIINDFINTNPTLPIQVLKSPYISKKRALDYGIRNAKFDWIITTDADCILPHLWLQTYDSFLSKNKSKLIASPVVYSTSNSFLDTFQELDFLSLMGSTIGGFAIQKPFLCNGANLCYYKPAFLELNGFEGNENIASGDDIFLLEKMVNSYPKEVYFMNSKAAIVRTKPQETFKDLVSQRLRWAAKTTAYKNKFGKIVGTLVFTMNLLWLVLLLNCIYNYQLFIAVFFTKFTIDYLLIKKTANLLSRKTAFKTYFLSSFIYPVFTVFIALQSFTKEYSWKGRKSLK